MIAARTSVKCCIFMGRNYDSFLVKYPVENLKDYGEYNYQGQAIVGNKQNSWDYIIYEI